MATETMVCRRCDTERSIDRFRLRSYPDKPPYRYKICKDCCNNNKIRWYHARPEGVRQEENFLKNISTKYGITTEERVMILLEQNGKCAICHEDFTETPCIDHCHKTGRVRGLLCQKCNQGIGLLQESVDLLRSAQDYLLKDEVVLNANQFAS